jgi:putative transposase
MRKSKFTDSQIIDAVKRVAAGFGVPDLCRKLGNSTATFYKCRAKYGGMYVSTMSRMKELEEKNRRLKKMYLEEKIKVEIVSEALEKKWRGHSDLRRWP